MNIIMCIDSGLIFNHFFNETYLSKNLKLNNMKKMMFLAMILMVFAGCKKEVEGPAGPRGADGNANVQSEEITVLSTDWEGGSNGFFAEVPCSVITEDIAATGAVMAYLKAGDYYQALPYSIWSTSSWTTHVLFDYTAGSIGFIFQDDDGFTPSPGERVFKVVAIESRVLEANPTLDLANYDDVKRVLNLTE